MAVIFSALFAPFLFLVLAVMFGPSLIAATVLFLLPTPTLPVLSTITAGTILLVTLTCFADSILPCHVPHLRHLMANIKEPPTISRNVALRQRVALTRELGPALASCKIDMHNQVA